jgi:hypothetical protein
VGGAVDMVMGMKRNPDAKSTLSAKAALNSSLALLHRGRGLCGATVAQHRDTPHRYRLHA